MTEPIEGPRIPDATRNWLRERDGSPAAVAVQPKFLDSEAAFLSGCVARVASLQEIDILNLLAAPPRRARASSGF
jgi:hypothetical protein